MYYLKITNGKFSLTDDPKHSRGELQYKHSVDCR